jgi:putative addiction module killer protein
VIDKLSLITYNNAVIEIEETIGYKRWIRRIKDDKTVAIINSRLSRVALGNLGDAKSVGGKVWELRIDYGPGYRVYFTWRGKELIILLAGGDKTTQSQDISKAQKMAQEVE